MAYTRHTWQSGEVISSALLNNIEDGIEEAASSGGGGERFIIECTLDEATNSEDQVILTHNATIQEAYDAFESGKEIWLKINYTDSSVSIRFQQVEQADNLIGFVGVSFKRQGYDLFMFSKDNEVTRVSYTINNGLS